jgi:hypothetical protein
MNHTVNYAVNDTAHEPAPAAVQDPVHAPVHDRAPGPARGAAHRAAHEDEQPGRFWYVYAVTPAGAGPLPEGLRGVDGGTPRTMPDGALAAVVSPVSPADFAAEPLRGHLEDLRWLERTARGHQRVVDGLTPGSSCVLPMRLATVCRSPAAVRQLLAANRRRFTDTIERLDGRTEWGVKVYADLAAPAESTPASGRDYLRQRSRHRRETEESWQRAEAGAHAVHEALAAVAERFRLHPPQDARLSGTPGRNLLNGAYLLPREREREFCALVGRLAGELSGPVLSLTGPWAPYSFTGDAGAQSGPPPEREPAA